SVCGPGERAELTGTVDGRPEKWEIPGRCARDGRRARRTLSGGQNRWARPVGARPNPTILPMEPPLGRHRLFRRERGAGRPTRGPTTESVDRRTYMRRQRGRMATLLLGSLALALLSGAAGPARAAWEPTKPIEFIVPAGTGGGADQM